MKRKFMVSALGALCVLAVGGVFTALAAGGYGSQDDPLVTLSYITDVAVPEANARIDSVFSQKETAIKSDIQSKMDSVRSRLESQISQLQNVSQDVINQVVELVKDQIGSSSGSSTWKMITLQNGQQIKAGVGTQLLLRRGTASCYSGMINLSSGEILTHGQSVLQNNMYLIGTDGCGFIASGECTVLVDGTYTIG